MLLKEQLDQTFEGFKQNLPPEVFNNSNVGVDKINALDIAKTAVTVGDEVPDFELPNATGTVVRLSKLLSSGPAIISFYRGGWCPYCVLELKAYRDILPQIEESGGNLIAISPEMPDNSMNTAEKNELDFAVLSDAGNIVARSFKLTFDVPEEHKIVHKAFDIPLDQWNGSNEWELPVPGTFVVGQDRRIVWSTVLNNHHTRPEPQEALLALQTLTGYKPE